MQVRGRTIVASRRPLLRNAKSDQARPNDPPLQEQMEFKLLSSIVYVISVTVDYSLCRIDSIDSATEGQVRGRAEPGCSSLEKNIHFAKAENTYESGGG